MIHLDTDQRVDKFETRQNNRFPSSNREKSNKKVLDVNDGEVPGDRKGRIEERGRDHP